MFERHFQHLVSTLQACSKGSPGSIFPGAVLLVQWRAERSDFVRFNQARLRQAGTVERFGAEFRLILGQRTVSLYRNLTGDPDEDRMLVNRLIGELNACIADAVEDPHLLINSEAGQSHDGQPMPAIDAREVVQTVQREAEGQDLVGAFMNGPMASGFWSSLGAQHYFERSSWSLDYSIYAQSEAKPELRDKAIKATVAGDGWEPRLIRDSIQNSLGQLDVLYRKPIVLEPGSYRALLAPAAVGALIEMMCWGGFSARSERTGQSPLAKSRAGAARFSRQFNLSEDLRRIPAPRFQADGFVRPVVTDLVRDGEPAELFCSPRTAREFGLQSNGADRNEGPVSLFMRGGKLQPADELAALGQGLSISNLWYLNFSDRTNCRVTGMTRFASIWVDKGQWVAPIVPMRFDDSLFSLLGSQLLDLGCEPHRLPQLDSYDWRSASASLVPSALIQAMRFTL